jgi:hypothetical protein
MKFACQKTLIIGIVASGLLADCQTLFSSQKAQQMSRQSDMDRALSANESMLRRFEKEREDLLRNRTQDDEPHLVTNKLKILDNKIMFLERELDRGKHTNKTPVVLQKTPVTLQKKPQTGLQKTPVTLQWRPYAKPEPRRRIFLAMIVKKVGLQPSQKSSSRQKPALLAFPEKVSWLPFSKVSDRKTSSVPAPVRIKENVSLQPLTQVGDKIILKLPKTGLDWKTMTQGEKEIYILSMMGNLSHRDVFLEKSYIFYVDAIDSHIQTRPSLENEYIHNILIASAYEHEPESRQDIDNIGK